MFVKSLSRVFTVLALAGLVGVTSCSRDGGTQLAGLSTEGAVFLDDFGSGVTYAAFLGSDYFAMDKDITEKHSGTTSLNVIVPDSGNPAGSYAGGAFYVDIGRDLSGFNALTFWAKASREAALNVVGFGNDNSGTSQYIAEMQNVPLTTEWQQYVIPIPLADKLISEKGLFYYAEGPENGVGCHIWFDDIVFQSLAAVTDPAADLGSSTVALSVGETDTLPSFPVTYNVNGVPHTVMAMAGYLTFTSTNSGIVAVGANGAISGLSEGTATLTAKLGSVNASGSITVTVTGPEAVPTVAADAPTAPAIDVVSLYSDAYSDVTVGTWSAEWDDADVSDETVAADNVKKYTDLVYAGILFETPTINVSGMTRFHMDIWTPSPTAAPAKFKIKLVDFGADGAFEGGDDVEHEITLSANTSPALTSESWVSIDIPLTAFSGLLTRAHLAQMIISGDLSTVYIDNIYFYDAGLPTVPIAPAPIPNKDPGTVISMYSDAYTDVTVDTWSTIWDLANVEEFVIGSDASKKYTNLTFAAVEATSSPIDVSAMTHFHMDVWTPDATSSPSVFRIKLVDFGADGRYQGGDDVDDELIFDESTMSTGIWISIDVRLSDFADLTTREHIGQLIISGDLSTVFVDNVYFYDSGIPGAPPVAAPTPTAPEVDVVSLFSDAYTDVTVDTWSTPWDTADVEDYVIGSDTTKKYTNLLFAGIEFTSATVDASAMNYFHMDVWTPDETASPATFSIKLVDFGADGSWQGGDDVEHEITLDDATMRTGSWVSIDVPLTDFINLTTRGHLAQLIISGDPNTIFIDNVYFHK